MSSRSSLILPPALPALPVSALRFLLPPIPRWNPESPAATGPIAQTAIETVRPTKKAA